MNNYAIIDDVRRRKGAAAALTPAQRLLMRQQCNAELRREDLEPQKRRRLEYLRGARRWHVMKEEGLIRGFGSGRDG